MSVSEPSDMEARWQLRACLRLAWADEDTLAEWVDGKVEQAEFYHLDERGRYQRAPVDAAGVYRSRVIPGLWLRVDWLWQQPLPSPTRALLEIDCDA